MFRSVAALLLSTWLSTPTPPASHSPGAPPPHLPIGSEALHAALRQGKIDAAQRLLASGTEVDARDALGNTPLLYAAWSGNSAVVSFLLEHGANANALQSGPPALSWAVLSGRTPVVRLLLNAGAHSNWRDSEGGTLLHSAARYGYDGIAELLLAAHSEVDAADAAGRTPLDEAVLFAQAAVVPVLLQHGADATRVHPLDGRGPLHEACIKGSAALIEILVNAGADPAGRDKTGQTPLDLALAYKNRGAIAALERLAVERSDCAAAAGSAMESATLRGRTEIVRLLLEGGFNLNGRLPDGSTYLHVAALKAQAKIAALLLDRGAAIDARDASGATALHNAALAGAADVITLLLDRGAAIDVRESDSGATPLMLAASVSRTAAVALLLNRGANPALRDRSGHTALDRALETEDRETLKLLQTAPRRGKSIAKTAD